MKHSDTIASLAAALAKAQGEFKTIAFDADNPHFKSKFASLPATVESVRATLAKYGIAVVQGSTVPETNEGQLVGFGVETTLIHSSGEWLSTVVIVPVEKPTAQGAGSGLTYGRRYGLQAALCLVSDDDDGETATNHPQTPRPASPAAPASRSASKPTPSTHKPVGKSEDVSDELFPFGRNKGRRLGDFTLEELASAKDWCIKTDREKFRELIGKLARQMYLTGGMTPPEQDEAPEPEEPQGEDLDSELPF